MSNDSARHVSTFRPRTIYGQSRVLRARTIRLGRDLTKPLVPLVAWLNRKVSR